MATGNSYRKTFHQLIPVTVQEIIWTLIAVFFPTWAPTARRHIDALHELRSKVPAA